MNKISLLFYDNPIARAYTAELILNNQHIDNVIFIVKPEFKYFPYWYSSYLTYLRNNYYAINFLKNKKILDLRKSIVKALNLNEFFYNEMFSFKNIKKISKNKIRYVVSENLNDKNIYNVIKGIDSNYIIFSGGGILKTKMLKIKKKFIHIHPGYLPDIRGADATLWSILKNNEYASTSFILDNKIDAGKIIYQKKIDFFNINKDYIKDLSYTEIYRLIYSFIDPLIRSKILIKTINNIKENKELIDNDISKGNYYSFMNNEDKEKVFKKIFV